jgi:hypothetical protein
MGKSVRGRDSARSLACADGASVEVTRPPLTPPEVVWGRVATANWSIASAPQGEPNRVAGTGSPVVGTSRVPRRLVASPR